MLETINSFSGRYRFLSNFHILTSPIHDNMRVAYFSVENAYQAAKTVDRNERLEIKSLPPNKAKIAGRQVTLRPDWERIKRPIMLQLLLQKFTYNPDLADALRDTGQALLEEGNHWGDTYWGTVNGRGQNHLGKLLMQVKEVFRDDIE